MLVDKEEKDSTEKSNIKNEIGIFKQIGSGCLILSEYYNEEKELVKQPNTFKLWEKFINKYFSQDCKMKVKFFDNQTLSYKFGKIFYLFVFFKI